MSTLSTLSMGPDVRLDRTGGRPGFLRRFLHHPIGILFACVLAGLIGSSFAAPLLAPYPAEVQDLANVLAGPSAAHLLGTDSLGRDVLSRLLYGGQVTFIGVGVTVAVVVLIGVPTGLVAGYFGGARDSFISRVADIGLSIPAIVVLLVLLAVFPSGDLLAMTALGVIISWSLCRVTRSAVIAVRNELYVLNAQLAGVTGTRIVIRHFLGRAAGPIVVNCAVAAAVAMVMQAGLGFLGLGVIPPDPSWGGAIAEAQKHISQDEWLLVPSGGVIALAIVSFVFLGDAVRDTLEERWASAAGGRSENDEAQQARDRTEPTGRSESGDTRVTANGALEPEAIGGICSVRGLTIVRSTGKREVLAREVCLDVQADEAVGIVGESGSGKTLTALAMIGLLPRGVEVTAGTCLIGGKSALRGSKRDRRSIRREVGYVSQEPTASLDPNFTIGSQLSELVRRHRGVSSRLARRRAIELLSEVRLAGAEGLMRRYPHEISGGMAQRVGIACALAGQPRLLIADEPTTALDVTVQAQILTLLRELRAEHGMGLLLISHDWGVISDSCDRVVVFYAGEVVESGGVVAIVRSPRHPYTDALIKANPQFSVEGEPFPTIPGRVPVPGDWPRGCHFAARCPRATTKCLDTPVRLESIGEGHVTRCIHHQELEVSTAE